jgi:hypothetical protein
LSPDLPGLFKRPLSAIHGTGIVIFNKALAESHERLFGLH